MIFVDTSAIYALLASGDEAHRSALRIFDRYAETTWMSHDFVLSETLALLHHRLGPAAVTTFLDDLAPLIEFSPVSLELRDLALEAYRRQARRRSSFVDVTSFEFLRMRRIPLAFAFDDDFKRAGFALCKP